MLESGRMHMMVTLCPGRQTAGVKYEICKATS